MTNPARDRVLWWIAFVDAAEAHGLDPLQILDAAEELRLAGKSPRFAVVILMPQQKPAPRYLPVN